MKNSSERKLGYSALFRTGFEQKTCWWFSSLCQLDVIMFKKMMVMMMMMMMMMMQVGVHQGRWTLRVPGEHRAEDEQTGSSPHHR